MRKIPNIKVIKIIFFTIVIVIFFALSHISHIYADEVITKSNHAVKNQETGEMKGEPKADKGRLTPNNQDETILSIAQWKLHSYVDIRVPIPAGLVLAKPDRDPSHCPKLDYFSSLDNWRAYKELKSGQPLTSDLLLFHISACGPSKQEEVQREIKIMLGSEAIFFGNIPDTYMAFKPIENSDYKSINLYGLTKIDTEPVSVFISFVSQNPGSEDLEQYKKIMEEYFLKLRKINTTPLVTYELKPLKPVEKCIFPGGPSVSDADEITFTFRDCAPNAKFDKKVPMPAGFKIVEDAGNNFENFIFVSDLETWRKYEKKKSEAPFKKNLIIFNVSRYYFLNSQDAHDSITQVLGGADELNTFGDLPDTYMIYRSFPAPTCSVNLMGSTKIHDEYVLVFINALHGCSPDKDDEVYKKMMIDYMRKIREVNKVNHPTY